MVFDEVDAGIGGAVAEIVGRELRSLGEGAQSKGQALCVTHLAQVAAQGHQHLRVSKLTDGRSTRIKVGELRDAARVEELARMLGGVEITERARSHAREMLERAGQEAGRRSAEKGDGKVGEKAGDAASDISSTGRRRRPGPRRS